MNRNLIYIIMVSLVLFLQGCSGLADTDRQVDVVSEGGVADSGTDLPGDSVEDEISIVSPDKTSETELSTVADTVESKEAEGCDAWIGSYSFAESVPPDETMFYCVEIYKEDDIYLARVSIDGFQTMSRFAADVKGDENHIDLTFREYRPDNMFETYEKGELLFSLKMQDSEIQTVWEVLSPINEETSDSGVFFKKE